MTDTEIILFNKNFQLTWEPTREKIKPYLIKRKRMTITVEKLHEVVGEKRADFIIEKCLKLKKDKKRFYVQNKGKLDVYVK
jgi:hypothetical protein